MWLPSWIEFGISTYVIDSLRIKYSVRKIRENNLRQFGYVKTKKGKLVGCKSSRDRSRSKIKW